MKHKIKIAFTLILAAVTLLLIKSCKKVDDGTGAGADAIKERIQQQMQKDYGGNISASYITPINQVAQQVSYKDKDGKIVALTNAAKQAPGLVSGLCLGDCNTLSNPADLRIIFKLTYSERYYLCESNGDKSNVRVKWTASVPFGFTDPYGRPGRYTANVRFKDASGNVLNTYTVTPLLSDLVSKGTDPACSYNSLWEIYYNVTNIPNSDFASGNTVEADVDFYTDCALSGNYVSSGYVAGPSFSQDGYLPCNRIDKVFFAPPSTIATGNATAVCTQPSGWQYIDYHQLEYRPVTVPGNYNWDDQTSSPIYWGTPSGGGSTLPNFSPFAYVTMPSITSGWWLVRYRNVKTGTCDIIYGSPSAPGQPWGNTALWITEAYYF